MDGKPQRKPIPLQVAKERTTNNMKAFILLCLAAVAFAEPEADPQYLYSGAGYPYYSGYAAGYSAYSPYTYAAYSPYTYAAGAHYLGKREAEAKPEADPQFLYSGYSAGYPYYSGYAAGYSAYSPYTYSAYSPYTYAAGAHYIGKREAEAKPEADPQLLYSNAAVWPYTAATYSYPAATYASPALTYAATPAVYAAPAVVAKPASYYANSGGAVHIVKREAEAKPQYYFGGAYPYSTYSSYAYPYSYSSYAGAYSYPYVY